MIGSDAFTAILGSGLDNKNHDGVRMFIREATKIGLSLLLILPDSKVPADMRTVRTRNADDRVAQEAAKAAGRGDWARVKSPSGLALASTDAKVVLKYLDEYVRVYSTWIDVATGADLPEPPSAKAVKDGTVAMADPVAVNLAVEVGESRLVVVDCDTAAQLNRFLQWTSAPADLPPTIKTPGVFKADEGPNAVSGQWLHKDGGHFYFTVPEHITLPDNLGAITMSGDDGFAVLWHRRYVLIPPSTRPEGPYTLTGRTYELIEPLRALITDAGNLRAERQQRALADRELGAVSDMSNAIDDWAEATPWEDVLEPLGWSPASRVDNCGCEVWTAGPGHASPKSATAHDSGCSLGRYTETNAPLHIWTDNPGEPLASYVAEHGTQTLSKLQVVALTRFDGNVGKAMDALGLTPPPPTIDAELGVDNGTVARDAGIDTSAAAMDRPLWGQDGPPAAPVAPAAPTPPSPFVTATVDAVQPIDQSGDPVTVDMGAQIDAVADIPDSTSAPVAELTDEQRDRVNAALAAATAKLTTTCQCGAVVGINGTDASVAADADGDLWHNDANGGHLVNLADDPAEIAATIAAQIDAGGSGTTANATADATIISADVPPPTSVTVTPSVPFVGVEEQQAAYVPPQPPPVDPDAPFADEADDPDPNVLNSATFGVPVLAPFAYWRDMPPPEYIIDGLIENGGLSCIIGPPGVGKSSVALDMACHIATGKSWQGRRTLKTKVLYMPGEGLSGAVQRIWAWEESHKMEVGTDLILANSIIKLGASTEAWQEVGNFIIRQGIGFIIFDTFARMATKIEENSATEVGLAVERLDQVRRHTNAGVLIVHHTGKHSEMARGSSALNGALDSELIVRNGNWDTAQIMDANGRLPGKPIELDTTKQKNAEQLEDAIPLLMVNWENRSAPIITGPGGSVDPMQGEIVLARPVPEVVVETAIKLRRLVDQHTEQGLSFTEIVAWLPMDAYTAARADAPKAWRQQVRQAIDLGLRGSYDLIATLTGTASGQRYIPSAGTIEGARQQYATDNITPTD